MFSAIIAHNYSLLSPHPLVQTSRLQMQPTGGVKTVAMRSVTKSTVTSCGICDGPTGFRLCIVQGFLIPRKSFRTTWLDVTPIWKPSCTSPNAQHVVFDSCKIAIFSSVNVLLLPWKTWRF